MSQFYLLLWLSFVGKNLLQSGVKKLCVCVCGGGGFQQDSKFWDFQSVQITGHLEQVLLSALSYSPLSLLCLTSGSLVSIHSSLIEHCPK